MAKIEIKLNSLLLIEDLPYINTLYDRMVELKQSQMDSTIKQKLIIK